MLDIFSYVNQDFGNKQSSYVSQDFFFLTDPTVKLYGIFRTYILGFIKTDDYNWKNVHILTFKG